MKEGIDIFSLKGKTALITGATGYLGSAMSYIFAEAGAKVFINSKTFDSCEILAKILRNKGYEAESATFDITCQKDTRLFIDRLEGKPLHILVNNAYYGGSGSMQSTNVLEFKESYDISVIAAYHLMTSLLPNLRLAVHQDGDASIINIASMYGLVSPDQRIYESASLGNPPFYGAAKAALLQLTRYASCEFGRENIRVNAISPGPFPSEGTYKSNPSLIKHLKNKIPMGRVGISDEIKGPALFLASSSASFVNGANLIVDGGWTCW
jgi:NAD(P)-dependent dehydrogenase (short-subunit alcohol dehydrogenase family)